MSFFPVEDIDGVSLQILKDSARTAKTSDGDAFGEPVTYGKWA